MFRDEWNVVCCSPCSRTCCGRVGRVVQLLLCPGILYLVTCSVSPAWVFVTYVFYKPEDDPMGSKHVTFVLIA